MLAKCWHFVIMNIYALICSVIVYSELVNRLLPNFSWALESRAWTARVSSCLLCWNHRNCQKHMYIYVWCLFQSMSRRHGSWMFPLKCIGAKLWRHGMIRLFQGALLSDTKSILFNEHGMIWLFQGARPSCQALIRWPQSVFWPCWLYRKTKQTIISDSIC